MPIEECYIWGVRSWVWVIVMCCLGAVSLLRAQPPETVEDRYLRGRTLEDQGDHCAAARAFDLPSASLPGVVQTDVRRRWARSIARCGQCKEALEALRELTRGRSTQARADHALLAKCHYDLRRFEEAATEYRALLRRRGAGVGRVDATLQLARALVKLDKSDDAKEVLGGATIKLAANRHASRISDLLTELGGVVPRDEKSRLQRAEVYYKARRYKDVERELAGEALPAQAAKRAKWLHLRGMALFRMRNRYDDAAKELSAAAAAAGRRGMEDQFHAARALSRAGHDRVAIRDYRALVRRYPAHPRAAEAEYLAGWLEIRLGLKRGEQALERLLRGPRRRVDKWRRKALWQLGFRALERRQYARAKRFLLRYAKEKTSRMEQAQASYWLGRAYQGMKKWGLAIKAYRATIDIEPLHWYASLAADRLLRLKRKPGDPFGAAPKAGDGPKDRKLKLPASVRFYLGIGLRDDAVSALRHERSALLRDNASAPRDEVLAQAYLDVGAYNEAYRFAARLRDGVLRRPEGDHAWWWKAAYPQPWRDLVDRWTRQTPITPAYVYATMRQESGYNPTAVSRASARGLLQLMPKVASRLARSIGVTVDKAQLFEPDWNIRLGVVEMDKVFAEYKGVMPLSIAAYNAGSRRVREWLKRSGRMELDRFVERIPFDETRNYVRRVMSHYARYRFLVEGKGAWPLKLPRRVQPPGPA